MSYPRILIVIPAYNEAQSISNVILALRKSVPDCHRLIVNDGSSDDTADVLTDLKERQITHPCNLGYGRALQTGMKYALKHGYHIIVSFDADGQHRPEDLPGILKALFESQADLVIGSRYIDGKFYSGPLNRRIGQQIFSHLTELLIGCRIYDTTSGFKAMKASTCENIVHGTFMDFHIETIVRLSMSGYRIIEHPVTVDERKYGESMHYFASNFAYPLKTLFLTVVALLDVYLSRRIQ